MHNQLHFGGEVQQIGNHVGRAGQKTPLQKHDVGGVALDGGAQILERIRLRHHAQIVFECKNLANADAVNGLGVRKNYANRPRLDRSVKYFAINGIVQKVHS